ncbi:RNase H [Popillia japonica]|uniref:RNase H n=1 Tax=Popillia japonica TaxID=7064 RepID=A0AAW1LWZ2_POPJA
MVRLDNILVDARPEVITSELELTPSGGQKSNETANYQRVLSLCQSSHVVNVVIFADSQAAIRGLCGLGYSAGLHPLIADCRRIISQIKETGNVTLVWVTGHKGIFGNEKAGFLAEDESNELFGSISRAYWWIAEWIFNSDDGVIKEEEEEEKTLSIYFVGGWGFAAVGGLGFSLKLVFCC